MSVPATLIALACLGWSCGAAASPAGTAVAVRNIVTIAAPPAAGHAAAVGSAIATGDLLATGADSAAKFRLADGTAFSLGAAASVRVDSFVFDSRRNASAMSLAFLKGAFRFVSGAPTHAHPGQVALTTPAASIGIRGTVIDGLIGPQAAALHARLNPTAPGGGDPETATLIVLAGGAQSGGADVTAAGATVPLRRSGQAVFVRAAGERATGPFTISADMLAVIARMAGPELRGGEGARGGDAGRDRQDAGAGRGIDPQPAAVPPPPPR